MRITEISRWQSCRLEDRKTELPTSSGIYAVLDKNKVMYIGRSGNLRKRWSSGHHRYHQAVKLKDPRLAWILLSKREINKVETAFIKQYQPTWNWTKVEETSGWVVVWKPRLIALGWAAIAGIFIGLISLQILPPTSAPPDTQQLPE
ncbi:MAG: hypothetical protein AAGB19_08845 [Cyanobacteria bacterium P01_F01_bin.3]